MKTYFTVEQVPQEAFVGFMLMKIVPKYFIKIKKHQNLDYIKFREKLLEVFKKNPNLATAYMGAYAAITQDRKEIISEYMHRV